MTILENYTRRGEPTFVRIVEDDILPDLSVQVVHEDDEGPACIVIEQDDQEILVSYEQAGILASALNAYKSEIPRV